MMRDDLHPLLARQLKKRQLTGADGADEATFDLLLTHVSRVYTDFDQERYLLDRSQNIASAEMAKLNAALQESQARLSSLLSLSTDWVWEQDTDGHFTFVSEQLEARTGLNRSALLGHACSADGVLRTAPDELSHLHECTVRHERFQNVLFEVVSAHGQRHWMRIAGEPLFEGRRFIGYRGVGSDVTSAALSAQKIEELARFDSLTGLPNRHVFMEELNRAFARAARYQRRFALLFIDLDRFKSVNDNLGHEAGDVLLQTIGKRLATLLRDADLLARLGGDEFVVLTEGHCDSAALVRLAERVLSAVAEPVQIENRKIEISASIGISIYSKDIVDAPSLLRAADAAMYQAKSCGKNTFGFFTADLAQRAALHFALEGDLRYAVQREQLELHYQPQVDAATGELVGMEALLRWNHPQRGLLSPALFIPLAEESGLIVPIGRWVLRAACSQMAIWQAQGYAPPRCAVNISVRQITSDTLLADVRSALAAAALDARHLEIEVTESMLMADAQQAAIVLEEISKLGVHIAIDDFGTGYSSLSCLKRFPVGTLKIDQSFVRDLPSDADGMAITRAVVALGHTLALSVVAEGVETTEQRDCLTAMGCDVLQGYLIGRPVDSNAFELWLRRSREKRLLSA